ncbi:glycosyltransferase [Flavobacterium sandaracinum]|uniref:Glycosyltransferase n=1 Tax=Flavobacterium sandaracinum TaxID=2541733 RepID=A0A4R5CW65_9FLAO|nr:glycosyltransferase [Flavobacterium sandaracinum]TDE02053.1 glycosyltransferase [Flavobacterium sandaracinum]
MKLLILSSTIPYPLSHGGNVAQFSILSYLQNKLAIDYCCVVRSNQDLSFVEELKIKLPQINFIIINQIPVLKSKAKQSLFSRLELGLYFLYKKRKEKRGKLKLKNIDSFKSDTFNLLNSKEPVYINEIANLLKLNKWDIIQTEFYEMIDLVTIFPINVKKVFVSHESRTLRLLSASDYSSQSESFKNYIIGLNRIVETTFLSLYDSVVVFSDYDAIRLQDIGVKNITVSPFTTIEENNKLKPFVKLEKLFFLGGSNHSPNCEGLQWFITEIYPEIYKKHQLPLYIIGYWSEKAKIISDIGEVVYLGYVENLNPIIENAVMIVPIRVGNGIRTKIILGLQSKVPMVSTSLGAEGIGLTDEINILIADEIQSFIDKIDLLKNTKSEYVINLVDNGYEFYEKNFSQDLLGSRRLDVYKNLID